MSGAEHIDVERPLLVCGVGRSGTSLLQAMLAAHPDVAFPPETRFFRRYVAHRGARRAHEAAGARAFATLLRDDAEFARTGIDASELLVGEDDGLDLARVHRSLLRACAHRVGATRVGGCADTVVRDRMAFDKACHLPARVPETMSCSV